jgi:hypothetical protein
MAKRPRVFELDEVEAALRRQGVPEDRLSQTVSFMRLVVPLVVARAGTEGIMAAVEDAFKEWGVDELPGFGRGMAPSIVQWAAESIESYRAERMRTGGA